MHPIRKLAFNINRAMSLFILNDGMKSAVKLLRKNGMGIKKIAKLLQIVVGAVYAVL
jgi:hypothetical protein